VGTAVFHLWYSRWPDAADPCGYGRPRAFLNARDTLRALLDNNIVPVINENDAVATAEIKVGDNDNLSALAAILAGADKLLLLTDQPGLFTADRAITRRLS
jgi:glutamate 5-kinase